MAKKEISDSLKIEIQNKYNEIGNIKEIAKIYHISFNTLKRFIVFKNPNRVKVKKTKKYIIISKKYKNENGGI